MRDVSWRGTPRTGVKGRSRFSFPLSCPTVLDVSRAPVCVVWLGRATALRQGVVQGGSSPTCSMIHKRREGDEETDAWVIQHKSRWAAAARTQHDKETTNRASKGGRRGGILLTTSRARSKKKKEKVYTFSPVVCVCLVC